MSTFRYALTTVHASKFAGLALGCVGREFPYQPQHMVTGPSDVHLPRELHPAFYGCFDWHSAVHGHWLLVRILRRFPDLPDAGAIRATLNANLSEANLQTEAAYIAARRSFERTYGWTWLLKLAQEASSWDDPDGQRWAKALQPLAREIIACYLDLLPKQTYPIRTGTHQNTAFGLAFALDYANDTTDSALRDCICTHARAYYGEDRNVPLNWEPNGNDFLSPALIEADLMWRILPSADFVTWLSGFWPGLTAAQPANVLTPVHVTDPSDGQLTHLDGLNLSRAWCMWNIGRQLPPADPRRAILFEAAGRHAEAGLASLGNGDYMSEHWTASFALHMVECAEAALHPRS